MKRPKTSKMPGKSYGKTPGEPAKKMPGKTVAPRKMAGTLKRTGKRAK